MSDKDLYSILGVSKNATPDELKRAYRKLSMQYHPDRQNGKSDSERHAAEERFKEINAAYAVLSDSAKRENYDKYGSPDGPQGTPFGGFGGGGFNPFDFFREMHSGFGRADGFGGMFSGFGFNMDGRQGHRPSPTDPEDGTDIRVGMNIKFKESIFGTTKEFELDLDEICPHCHGKKSTTGKSCECKTCHGQGSVVRTTRQGFMTTQSISECPDCHGMGYSLIDKCPHCNGSGKHRVTRKLNVKIPQGVDCDTTLRLANKGLVGLNGGRDGSIFIKLNVEKSDLFDRKRNDIFITHYISAALATLGGKIDVPTINGYKKLTVNPGTKTGKVVRMTGMGVKTSQGVGDQYVTLVVDTYANLSNEQKTALETLRRLESTENLLHSSEMTSLASAYYNG